MTMPPSAGPQRAARVIGALVVLGVAVALVVGRCALADASRDGRLEGGHDALARALRGDRAAFAEAERAFGDAAGGVVFDGYPLFAAELAKAFEEGRADRADPAVRPIVQALARGDFAGAVSQLPSIPGDFVGRAHLERLVLALARRKADHE